MTQETTNTYDVMSARGSFPEIKAAGVLQSSANIS